MSGTDCVMDPALCTKGLSIGMSLKFDQSAKDYKEPKYLIDTGAQSSQTRGVSMFVKDGKIFFTLAISQKVWEVRKKQFENITMLNFIICLDFFGKVAIHCTKQNRACYIMYIFFLLIQSEQASS